jgi:hypothetical protein
MDEGGRSTHTTGPRVCRLRHYAIKEKILKKYLVVKMAEGWSQVVNWVVMPGLYTMEAAQQFVASAVADEPGARYMIQEVGAA